MEQGIPKTLLTMVFDTCFECKVHKVRRGINVFYEDGLGVEAEWLGKDAARLELGATTIILGPYTMFH